MEGIHVNYIVYNWSAATHPLLDVSPHAHIPYAHVHWHLVPVPPTTWPDIAFVVSVLAQFMQEPARPHWEAAKCIVRYFKGMRDLELTY